MTTDDIEVMTGPELSAAVAVEVMGWTLESNPKIPLMTAWRTETGLDAAWRPHSDRNDLAVVVGKLTPNVANDAAKLMHREWIASGDGSSYFPTWLLVCDPAIICRAALRAVRGAKP